MLHSRQFRISTLLVCFAFVFGSALNIWAFQATPTITSLQATPQQVTSAGEVTTLTAHVNSSGSAPAAGEISFCLASYSYCDGSGLLARVPVDSRGDAIFRKVFGVGSYEVYAEYKGIQGYSASKSVTKTVTVSPSGSYASTVGYSAAVANSAYTLTAAVAGFGRTAPSGSVTFFNTSSNSALGSASMDAATQRRGFFTFATLNVGVSPSALVAGDFNQDGIQDFILGNGSATGELRVYLGQGGGNFSLAETIASGYEPAQAIAVDLNRDGFLDVVVVNGGDSSLSLLLGKGDGSFFSPQRLALGAPAISVLAGDWNHNGLQDLAVLSRGAVTILSGSGDGSFQEVASYPLGNRANSFASGDFNKDGFVDLAISSASEGVIYLLKGLQDGSFAPLGQLTLSGSVHPKTLRVSDLRKNGSADLVVTDSNAATLSVLLSNGDGSFQSPVSYNLASVSPSLEIGDLNDDGTPDLVVANTSSVSVLLGKGDGSFAAKTDYAAGQGPSAIQLADWNGDGLTDILIGNATAGTATVLLANQTANAVLPGVTLTGSSSQQTIANYAGDALHSASSSASLSLSPSTSRLSLSRLAVSPMVAGSVTIAPTSSTSTILYLDTAGNVQPNLKATYRAYTVTNSTGSAIADVWVKVGSFSGSYLSLAQNETGLAHVGPMANGAVKVVYFYLAVDCSSFSAGNCVVSTPQTFPVSVYSGPPTTNLLATVSESLTIQETTAASANKVTGITVSAANPSLGSQITVSVVGSTGTMASDKTFYISPQAYYDFPANAFRLTNTSIVFSGNNTGTVTNQLLIPTTTFSSTANTDYTITYTYLVSGPTTAATTVSPVAFISSGGQMKHTGSYPTTIPPIGITSNTVTLQTLSSPSNLPTGGTETYTVRVTNSGSSSVSIDDFVATLPSSPASVTYVSNSSTFGGTATADPVISGNTLNWTKLFTIPANGTADLVFQVTIPNTAGTYATSAVAHVGTTVIDTTIATNDSSPASVNVTVGTPDLTVASSHTGNFSQSQTGAIYGLTATNSGNAATSGTVTVVDSLPSGLTATSIGGSGWTCTLGTLTCTRADALAAGSSYPVISLMVNVASNAASSVTNSVQISGGGETNTSNNTGTDVTTVGAALPSSTTTVSSSSSTVAYGGSVTLTSTVSPTPTGSPLGSVSFYSGATLLGSGTVNASGVATLAVNTLSTGSNSIQAIYSGNATLAGSTSSTITVTVTADTTTTSMGASPTTLTYGASTTLTATVTAGQGGYATGTVSFYNGATLLGSGTLSGSGQASLTTTALPVGANSVTATYSGNTNYASSNSSAVSVTVNQVSTATALGSSVTSAVSGASVTFTATVSPVPSGAPLGTVTFYNGATSLGSGTVNASGQATYTTTALPAGEDTITAVYSGNTNYATSTSSATTVTITSDTTTTLGSSASTVNAGSSITLTATVSPTPSGSPLGTVSFYNGATLLGSGSLNGSGQATYSTSSLPVGSNSLTATYSGNTLYNTSTSTPQSVQVNQSTSTAIQSSASQVSYGSSVTFTATVTPTPTGSPLGSVSFYDGATLLGTGSLNSSGIATYTTSSLAVATYSVTAVYGGNTSFLTSTSSPTSVTVNTATTTTALASSSTTISSGASVTLTATVSPAPTGTPLGSVSFYNGSTLLGSSAVNGSGVATLATTTLPVGANTLTAFYGGNANYGSSTSTGVPVTVNTATTTQLSASSSSIQSGASVTFTAVISPVPGGSPYGSVSFYNGSALLGTSTVNNAGQATYSSSSLPVGTNSITAVYSGVGNYGGSTSNATPVEVHAIATTTALSSSATSILLHASLTLTAQVAPVPSGGSPGTVSFYDGQTLLGTGTVDASGIAVLATSNLLQGAHTITAVYSGNTSYAASNSGSVTVTVSAGTSTTSLQASTTNPSFGTNVIFTTSVNPVPTGATLGTVSFMKGGNLLGVAPVNAQGEATLATTGLPVGANSITAVYSGNDLLTGSTSSPVTVTVAQGSTALNVTVSSSRGGTLTYGDTAAVATVLQGTDIANATGTMTYSIGGRTVATQAVSAGATPGVPLAGLAAGNYVLTVTYSGDASHGAATRTVNFTVAQAPLSISAADAARVYGVANPQFTGALTGLVNGDTLTLTFTTEATILSPAGTYTIQPAVTGAGAANYQVTPQAGKLTISQASLSLAMSPLTNAFAGGDITLTATATSSTSGVPSGAVKFFDGATLLGTGAINANGVATYTTNTIAQGTHSFSTSYEGDKNFTAVSSAVMTSIVNPAYTVTAPPEPVPLAPGGSAGVDVSIPPLGGAFNDVVTLSATGLPAGITATFDPPTVVPGASGAQTKMILHYASKTAKLDPQGSPFAPAGVAVAGLCLLFLGRKRLPKTFVAVLLCVGLLSGAAALTGCGGGWSNYSAPTSKTIIVTVIGTSGNIQRSTTVTVNLK